MRANHCGEMEKKELKWRVGGGRGGMEREVRG